MKSLVVGSMAARCTFRTGWKASSLAAPHLRQPVDRRTIVGRRDHGTVAKTYHLQHWKRFPTLTMQRFLSTNATAYAPKAWLDMTRSLESRVKALMDTTKIHPAEITNEKSNLVSLLTECCKMRTLQGMQLAQEIMERVLVEKERYRDENTDVLIPVKTWEVVLYGWANLAKSHEAALPRMRDLMDFIIEEGKADTEHLKRLDMFPTDVSIPSEPTVYTFNTLINGLAQAALMSPEAAKIAEDTLFQMIDYHTKNGWHTNPNTRSYTYVIKAHANSGHEMAGKNALAILRYVKAQHKVAADAFFEQYGVKYDEKNTNTTTRKIVTVDAMMYTVAMEAVLKSPITFGHEMRELLDDAIETGVADELHFNLALRKLSQKIEYVKDWKQRLDYARLAEKILWKSTSVSKDSTIPAVSTFNECLNVWSRSFSNIMGQQCEGLLKEMLGRGLVPDCDTFNFVIRAWSKSYKFKQDYALERVEAVLKLQHDLAEKSTNGDFPYPSYQAYALAILAQEGRGKDPIVRATALLEQMLAMSKERKLTLNKGNPCSPFSSLLSVTAAAPAKTMVDASGAALWSEDDVDPYEVACSVYEYVTENTFQIDGLKADHHFYGAFLRNLVAHGNPAAVDFGTTAQRVWEHACEAGQVSRLVFTPGVQIPDIRDTLPDQQVKRTKELPRFWWRNVEPRWR